MYAEGDTQSDMSQVGDGGGRKISAIYIVEDIQSDISPVEVEGGEENLCHVHSGETLSDTCP